MAKFTKGNPGKPKGAKNRNATRIELSQWIDKNFIRFNSEMSKVKGARFCELYIKAMEFVMPKYSAINFSLSNMSEQDLEFLISKLKETMTNEEN